jgi:hypothetical protein
MTGRSIRRAALLGLLAGACEEQTTEPDHAVEACQHLKENPTMISGSETPAAEVTSHKRYEISLLDGGIGGKTGTVQFQSAKAGHLQLFLTGDIPIRVTNPNGGELTASEVNKTGPCTELKAWYEYEVGAGPQRVTLGGSTTVASTIGLVIETEAHDH